MAEEMIRVGLVGVGVMGKKYAEMITAGNVPHMCLTAVVCRRPEMKEWGNNLPTNPKVLDSADELFENADLYDAVLIVTPHKTHPEFARRAFELGKHVLCDKPAGATIAQAIQMKEDSEKYDKVYGMIFHQRLYPKYRKIKEMIESGELGELKRIMLVNSRYFRTAAYHASGSWRSSWNGEGGGALINQGQHILDIWQWLFGMPDTLFAQIPYGKYNDFKVDDEATIQMHYADGKTAVFMLSTGEAVWEERLEIIGSKASLLLENDTLHITRYSMDSDEYIRTQQVTSRDNLELTEEVIDFGKAKEPYEDMLENFAQCVIKGTNDGLVAPGSDSVNPLMLTNAAYYSAWTGKSVELPLDKDVYEAEFTKHCEEETSK